MPKDNQNQIECHCGYPINHRNSKDGLCPVAEVGCKCTSCLPTPKEELEYSVADQKDIAFRSMMEKNFPASKEENGWESQFDKEFTVSKEERADGWYISEEKCKSFISKVVSQAYERGVREERERIREMIMKTPHATRDEVESEDDFVFCRENILNSLDK